MGWHDLGVVFGVDGQQDWMRSHAYVPTALVQHDRIRVFAAFWDAARIGRVGYVDLDRDDPTRVLDYAAAPVLDVGAAGAFDEHGTTPMAVVADGAALRLYYAGWQRSPTVRYLLFTGLAISQDGGATFTKVADVPVIDRAPGHTLVRTGFIARHNGIWKAWLAQSDGLIDVGGKPTPCYGLAYLESPDGLAWPHRATPCLAQGRDGIFGFGRSAVWSDAQCYHAMLSVRRRDGYRIEYARSADGRDWSEPAAAGFALLPQHTRPMQAETMFPSVVDVGRQKYAFYNGDRFGHDGIRCARWVGPES